MNDLRGKKKGEFTFLFKIIEHYNMIFKKLN